MHIDIYGTLIHILGEHALSTAAYQTELLLALRSTNLVIKEVPLIAPEGGSVEGGGVVESVSAVCHVLWLRATVAMRSLKHIANGSNLL